MTTHSTDISNSLTKDRIKRIFVRIKPVFKEKLGIYTHKKVSDNWYFHSLAFSHGRIGYAFGLNIGFFKYGGDYYNHVGMNVTVRANGDGESTRQKYVSFFRNNLANWISHPEIPYEYSDRGGNGLVFPKYKRIEDFENEDDMIAFFEECIVDINKIYAHILENPENIFDNVVRAAPFWDEGIIEICEERIGA